MDIHTIQYNNKFLTSIGSKAGRKLPVREFNCGDSGFLFITLVYVQLRARFCHLLYFVFIVCWLVS